MRIALYQPEISGNVGAALRTCACFGLSLEIIEPCGFPLTAKALRRAAMDYGGTADITRHADWTAFEASLSGYRLVLMTTKGASALNETELSENDVILFGNESSGVPIEVHDRADARIYIPQAPGTRSLNLSNALAVTGFELMRQSGGLEKLGSPLKASS